MTASTDTNAPVEYMIVGKESMGNGATVQSGHASVLLSDAGELSFPNQSLTVRELFARETVEFPFSALDQKIRTELRKKHESRTRDRGLTRAFGEQSATIRDDDMDAGGELHRGAGLDGQGHSV